MIPLAIGLFQLHLEFVNIILVYHLFGYPYAHTPYALGPSGGLRLQGLNPFGKVGLVNQRGLASVAEVTNYLARA